TSIEGGAQNDRLVAVGAGGDHVDRDGGERLQALERLASVGGQARVFGDSYGGLPPAGKILVDRVHVGIPVHAERRLGDNVSVHAISDAYTDGVQAIQHVQLGDTQSRDARLHDRAAQRDGIEPTNPAPAAGHRAKLVAHLR